MPVFMPSFKSINFYQNIPKIQLLLQKKCNFFGVQEAPPPDSRASSGWGLCLQIPSLWRLGTSPPGPENIPPLRISGYANGVFTAVILFCVD